ncbi:hypothetical protein XarbCFBP8150_11120 [Xanthomonas arboricola]|nr:hypothetical protein XarbCFBP8150_11120 [Xanthomonas arboricola]
MLEAYRRWGICRCQLGHMLAVSGAIQCRQSPALIGRHGAQERQQGQFRIMYIMSLCHFVSGLWLLP